MPPTKKKLDQLRMFAFVLMIIGSSLCTVGVISLVSSYAHLISELSSVGGNPTGETPKYAWCLYAGIAPLAVATALRVFIKTRRW